MKLKFTKMHGAGNDFVVLDGYSAPLVLSAAQVRALADRRFGIGADQVLLVEKPTIEGVDFRYRIFNCDGGEVEHCGNGARCFVRFVRERGLTDARRVRVQVQKGVIVLTMQENGEVVVDMGRPVFEPSRVPFDTRGLTGRREGRDTLWPLDVGAGTSAHADTDAQRSAGSAQSATTFAHAGTNAQTHVHAGHAAPVAATGQALADARVSVGRAYPRFAHDAGTDAPASARSAERAARRDFVSVDAHGAALDPSSPADCGDAPVCGAVFPAPDFSDLHGACGAAGAEPVSASIALHGARGAALSPSSPGRCGAFARARGANDGADNDDTEDAARTVRWISVVSMGNPHAVQVVDEVGAYPVLTEGPVIEAHPRFAQKVNAGFMQIVSRHAVKLRVYERGAGETLACGTGACAAVAAGIRRGLLDTPVRVHTRGGVLTIAWDGARDEAAPLTMAGPAVSVFEGEIALDALPEIAGDGGK